MAVSGRQYTKYTEISLKLAFKDKLLGGYLPSSGLETIVLTSNLT